MDYILELIYSPTEEAKKVKYSKVHVNCWTISVSANASLTRAYLSSNFLTAADGPWPAGYFKALFLCLYLFVKPPLACSILHTKA